MSKKITVHYELKTPTSGEEFSPWHTMGVAVEVTVDDDTQPKDVVRAVENLVKEAVFDGLGADAVVTEAGVMLPKPPEPAVRGGRKPDYDGPTVEYDGGTWRDFRPAKRDGSVKEKHPDFKTVDGKRSVWIVGKLGQPTREGSRLAELFANDAAVSELDAAVF